MVHQPCGRYPRRARYDVAFICNPTHLHAEAISQVAGKANACL